MLKKSPYNKREEANTDKSYKDANKSVKPVAKDTNKTRRKNTLLPLKNKSTKGKIVMSKGKKGDC
jgi:hypothetical protein